MAHQPSRVLRKRITLAVAALVTTALIVVVVFGSRGLLHLRALKSDEGAIRQRLALLLRENQRLRDQLRRLRTDDRYLERLAREQLGFVRSEDLVYRFPRQAPAADSLP